ncbi:MAG: glycosyltransferase family 4 protein [Flavobacterium sp.]|nr:glycosyltransferase family 4 protein [Pedobacter sp.]
MFSLTGGIEEVCKVFSRALFDMGFKLSGFKVFSMCDKSSERDSRYTSKADYIGFNYWRTPFVIKSVIEGIRSNIVVLSHINLLIVALIIKKLSPQTRIIVYAHGTEIWRKISKWKKTFLLNHCEFWAVSNFTSQKIQEFHDINSRQITIIPNCLDPFLIIPEDFNKPADLMKRYNLLPEQPILYTLTRLSSSELYKGYDQIIECLPQLINNFPNMHYLLAGRADKKESARLKSLIKKLGISSHITLTGFITAEELSDHFLLSDVFIMPSRKEGFGIVFIEAATCGCKIIAGNMDGSAEALLNGKLGTLVDPGDKEAILNAIHNHLKKPRSIKDCQTTQNLCLEHFNYKQYLSKVEKLLTAPALVQQKGLQKDAPSYAA